MGAWGILPFENDIALDNLALFENVDYKGIYGMLLLSLESEHEETKLMAITIIDAIVNGIDKRYTGGKDNLVYTSVQKITCNAGDEDKITELKNEALYHVKYLLQSESYNNWNDKEKRHQLLIGLQRKLERLSSHG